MIEKYIEIERERERASEARMREGGSKTAKEAVRTQAARNHKECRMSSYGVCGGRMELPFVSVSMA